MLAGSALLLAILAAIGFIILAASVLKIHPFAALLLAALGLGAVVGMPAADLLTAIQTGFGSLLGQIGMVVVLGAMLGVFLEKSGAALRLAEGVLHLTGRRRAALAMTLTGLVVGVPVFCDSGFIILSRLTGSLAQMSGTSGGVLSLSLASGLYASHTLVPPTPGPLAAAGNLGAASYLGLVIVVGLAMALPAALLALAWARFSGKKMQAAPDAANVPAAASSMPELPPVHLPGLLPSLLPIVLPVALIALASVAAVAGWEGFFAQKLKILGSPTVALLLGLATALPLARRQPPAVLSEWMSEGVRQAGPILIITGAGGSFGSVLKATPLAQDLQGWMGGGGWSGAAFLVAGWLVAALLKTAQGSTTSSMVVASSMMAPLLPVAGFDAPLEVVCMVMAVGGGAMTVSHANDSYFWVVSQMSGMPPADAFRSFTPMTGLMGLAVLAEAVGLFVFCC